MTSADINAQAYYRPSHDLNPWQALSQAVIQRALLEEGPDWAVDNDGRWWCEIVGLSPEYVRNLARDMLLKPI